MAFTDQATLADTPAFQSRVQLAVVTAAVQIAAEEVSGDKDDEVYAKRQVLANVVLTSAGQDLLAAFSWAVASNAAITSASADSDIQFEVNSVWNAIAGVRATD